MKRKVAYILLVSFLVACLSGFSVAAQTSKEYTYTIEDGLVTMLFRGSDSAVFEVPETIEGYPVYKVGFMHAPDNTAVKEVRIPKTVQYLPQLINCSNLALESIAVDPENPYFSSVDGVLYNKEQTVLRQYPAAKQGELSIVSTVKEIGDYAFENCHQFSHITIPEGVETIRGFRGLQNLVSVTLPSSLRTIDVQAFCQCSNLTTVVIPEGVTTIRDEAFFNCPKLTTVVLPRSLAEIGECAFGFVRRSSLDAIWYIPVSGFTIMGWKNLVAEEYTLRDSLHQNIAFIPLDSFADPNHPPKQGDVDGDGNVSAVDALYVLKTVVGKFRFCEMQIPVANMDSDEKITATDALLILRIVVGRDRPTFTPEV